MVLHKKQFTILKFVLENKLVEVEAAGTVDGFLYHKLNAKHNPYVKWRPEDVVKWITTLLKYKTYEKEDTDYLNTVRYLYIKYNK